MSKTKCFSNKKASHKIILHLYILYFRFSIPILMSSFSKLTEAFMPPRRWLKYNCWEWIPAIEISFKNQGESWQYLYTCQLCSVLWSSFQPPFPLVATRPNKYFKGKKNKCLDLDCMTDLLLVSVRQRL